MRKKALTGLALATALGVSLSACGTGGVGGAAAESTLTFAHDGGTQINFDPAAGSITVTPYLAPVYDTLIRRASDGAFTPNLAEKWEYTKPTEFRLTLRGDVKFDDGTPLDAAAVVANIENVKNGTGPLASDFASIETVTATDGTTVLITLNKPNPALPIALSGVSGMIANPASIKAGTLSTKPDGTGAYEYDAGSSVSNDTYAYTRNAGYWNLDHYKFNKIVVKVIPDAASSVNALQSGQVDMVELGTAADIVRAESAGLKFAGASNNVWTLHLDDRAGALVPALAQQKVRQALNYAVDRETLVKTVQQGKGGPTAQLVKPGMDGYEESLDKAYPYDQAKAKVLLAEAGYANGFSMDVVSLSLFDTQMQALAGYLSDIGVTLNIKNVSPDQYVPSILSGDYPAALLPYGMVDAYFDFGQLVVPGGGFNPFGSSDDQINRLYATASAGSDNSARSKDLKEINARVVELAWFLPMFTDAYGYVHNKNVSGVAWDTFRPPMYYDWAPAK